MISKIKQHDPKYNENKTNETFASNGLGHLAIDFLMARAS